MNVLAKPVSVFNAVLVWWADGLAAVSRSRANRSMPWRTMLLRRGSTIEVHVRRGQGTQVLGLIDPATNGVENRRVAARATADLQSANNLVLRLAPEEVIRTRLTLPVGVRDVLEKVLRNQIERVAPWPADQAMFAFAESGSSADGTLAVDLWVVSKARVNDLMVMLAELGLRPGVVDVGLEADVAPVINLRGTEQIDPARGIRARRAIVMCATVAVTLGAVGSAYGLYLDSRNQALEAEIQSAVQAMAAVKTRSPDLQRRYASAFDMRRGQPSISIMIEALSRALPDDAALDRIELRDGVLTLTGRAQNAPSLIAQLETSPHFAEVTFAAPTTRQDGEASVQFSISAKVVPQVALVPKSER